MIKKVFFVLVMCAVLFSLTFATIGCGNQDSSSSSSSSTASGTGK